MAEKVPAPLSDGLAGTGPVGDSAAFAAVHIALYLIIFGVRSDLCAMVRSLPRYALPVSNRMYRVRWFVSFHLSQTLSIVERVYGTWSRGWQLVAHLICS